VTLTVGILGASGVYARHLIPRLTARGINVRALVRRPEAATVARRCGAQVLSADIFDQASLCAGLEGCDIAVNLATSLPGPSGRGDYAVNDRLRREGTPVWVEATRRAGVRRILQQSIAMVNAAGTDRWCDEDTPYAASDSEIANLAVAAALSMEDSVRQSECDWLILRGGLFYGPGTGFDDDWFERAKAGKLRLPGDGASFVSLLHIADMAEATVAAIERWPSRQAIIVSDDGPARWREVFSYVAELASAPEPQPGGRMGFPSFRARNTRAKSLLGWKPVYPDYLAGLAR
jgi:nucleoside-diphosphate-sugar epimerase